MNFSLNEIGHDSDCDTVGIVDIIVAHGQIQGEENARHGVSRPRRSYNVFREFSSGHRRITLDYVWGDGEIRDDGSGQIGPIYSSELFERRFRVPK